MSARLSTRRALGFARQLLSLTSRPAVATPARSSHCPSAATNRCTCCRRAPRPPSGWRPSRPMIRRTQWRLNDRSTRSELQRRQHGRHSSRSSCLHPTRLHPAPQRSMITRRSRETLRAQNCNSHPLLVEVCDEAVSQNSHPFLSQPQHQQVQHWPYHPLEEQWKRRTFRPTRRRRWTCESTIPSQRSCRACSRTALRPWTTQTTRQRSSRCQHWSFIQTPTT